MTENCNGVKRKLEFIKGTTIMGMWMKFIVLVYAVYQISIGGKNEEWLGKIAIAALTYIMLDIVLPYGEKMVKEIKELVIAIKSKRTEGSST